MLDYLRGAVADHSALVAAEAGRINTHAHRSMLVQAGNCKQQQPVRNRAMGTSPQARGNQNETICQHVESNYPSITSHEQPQIACELLLTGAPVPSSWTRPQEVNLTGARGAVLALQVTLGEPSYGYVASSAGWPPVLFASQTKESSAFRPWQSSQQEMNSCSVTTSNLSEKKRDPEVTSNG